MENIKLIGLDTCFIRNIIHNNQLKNGIFAIDELKEIISYKNDLSFRVSETSLAELIIALSKKEINIEQWKERINLLDDLIDQAHPILPMGIDLAYEMNIRKFDSGFKPKSDKYWIACWSFIRNINSINDINNMIIYEDDDGRNYSIKHDLSWAEEVMKEERSNWINKFEETKIMVEEWNKNSEPKLITEDDYNTLQEIYYKNEGYYYEKIETMSKTYVYLFYRYINGTYHPESKNNYNDSLDFSLLQILEYPAILVTNDENLKKRAQTACPTQKNILTSTELLKYLKGELNHG